MFRFEKKFIGLRWLGNIPCCVEENKYSEYAADKKADNISNKMSLRERAEIAVIRIISVIRLIEGGVAIFAIIIRKSHVEYLGIIVIIPLII